MNSNVHRSAAVVACMILHCALALPRGIPQTAGR